MSIYLEHSNIIFYSIASYPHSMIAYHLKEFLYSHKFLKKQLWFEFHIVVNICVCACVSIYLWCVAQGPWLQIKVFWWVNKIVPLEFKPIRLHNVIFMLSFHIHTYIHSVRQSDVNLSRLALPCSRILLVQGGIYCLPCNGWACSWLPTYLVIFFIPFE